MQTLGRKTKIILFVLEIVALTVLAAFFVAVSIRKSRVDGGSLFFLCVFAVATAAQIFFFKRGFKVAPIIVLSAVKALLVCLPSCFFTVLWLSLPHGYFILDDVFITLTLTASTVAVASEIFIMLESARKQKAARLLPNR